MKKVITYGTFDLFHIGHLEMLRRAKELGEYLLVGISTDEFNNIKGTNISDTALYRWTTSSNPDLTLKERLRRRLELHKLSVHLKYPMPRVKEELTTLLEISKTLSNR